ncbi:putative E3 ubiquitin-protein ligase UBR2-like [Apostichopus japonicus]|uniref:E3 ubiquitin-protein ligase n=1 Tax=Stichopus japonicus TaxID=307972 RepID=A0A2G8LJ12_STIJA|nr:putative E3 ubiquitin-protein ligase UBR2-like [Apostichopus japonicus]
MTSRHSYVVMSSNLESQTTLAGPKYLIGTTGIVSGLRKHEHPQRYQRDCDEAHGTCLLSYRDCALDPTCVLCIDCFQRSGHKKHRYKMNTSGGGGYCDCGDAEAWTSDPACDMHGVISQQDQNPLETFSEDIIRRVSLLVQILINYCNRVINTDQQEVLPEELQSETVIDSYCTILFNDEVHTYEQVIEALKRAVGCKQKEALELATIVDKEGRTSVRNASSQDCEAAKAVIIQQTSRHQKPLKVLVMHSSVVSHQTFALKIMEWLIQISSTLDGLRYLVCQQLMSKAEGTDDIIIECSMYRDSKLWKAARTQWHELFMSTMLLDIHFKKEFAILLTKHYKRIQSDFAHDDHEHSVSVTAITVQVYTVPTMGLMLLREHNLLKVIIRSFLDCTQDSRNSEGKYVFQRGRDTHALRRIMISLTDIRYVLSNRPQVWDSTLRDMAMQGLEAFLELLKAMHGMDSVVRVVGHHIEYDPEWETGIQLNVAVKTCITLFLEWCTSDKSLLIKSYRATMKAYRQIFGKMTEMEVSFAGHRTTCFRYTSWIRKVQHQLPYRRALPNQPIQPIEMIEEPLRAQVLVAELHAGLWRRNGYSLVNQVFFYKNVKCREEMYDRDIQMLQVGASLMEPDDYMLCLLHRFELIRFLEISGGDTGHAEIQEILGNKTNVMEEFLHLLIIILCERYVIGIGEVAPTDGLRREVLHQLSINSMAHSELVKNLPENYLHETGVEEVIPALANYKKPTKVTEKGKYELKKECLKEYSPYFYHYSRSEQSKSEEQHKQRLEREGIKDEGSMFIPQLPPPLCPNFKNMVKILDCKMFISFLKVIYHRAIVSKGRLWSENLFQKTLYLVGIALLEEERSLKLSSPLRFTDRASRGEKSLLKLLQEMVGNPKVRSSTELLTWIFKKFDDIQRQKGTLPLHRDFAVPLEEKEPKDTVKEQEEKKRKAELAQRRREHLMAQMSAMQKSFIRVNPELFEATDDDDDDEGRGRAGSISSMDVVEGDGSGKSATVTLRAVGPNKSPSIFIEPQTVTCILCQEEERISFSGKAMVYSTFVQRSSVLSNSREKYVPTSVLDSFEPLFNGWDVFYGVHARTCGHVMHAACWQGFFETLVHRERRRVTRFRGELNYDISKNQFLCPLCETLSNTVLPILPPLATDDSDPSDSIPNMEEWLLSLSATLSVQRTVKQKLDEIKASKESKVDAATSSSSSSSSSSGERKRAHSEGTPSQEVEMTEVDPEGDSVDPPMLSCFPTLLCPSSVWDEHLSPDFFKLFSIKKPCSSDSISGTLQEMLKTFSQAAYTIGLRVMPIQIMRGYRYCLECVCLHHTKYRAGGNCSFLNLQNHSGTDEASVAVTIMITECDTLRSLVRHAILSSWFSNAAHIQKYVLRLLSVFDKDDTFTLGSTPSILEIDMFTLMVSLSSAYSALYQKGKWKIGSTLMLSGSVLNLYLLKLCFTIHLVQILLSSDIEDTAESMDEDDGMLAGDQNLADVYFQLNQLAKDNQPSFAPKAWTIQNHLKQASLPFLRWSALYFHFQSSVPHPVEFEQDVSSGFGHMLLAHYLWKSDFIGNSTNTDHIVAFSEAVYTLGFISQGSISQALLWKENLIAVPYLALPLDISEILNFDSNPVMKELIHGLCSKPSIKEPAKQLRHFPLRINQLINLPEDYMDLMNDRSLYVCPKGGVTQSEGRAPALCLICGTVVCSQSYCCQVEIDGETLGACSAHAIKCNEGTGIFLRVRECQLLLIASKNNSCSYIPPYVDEYGEPDQGLRRGNPLHLSHERYQELHKMWISHEIPAEVTRRLESNNNLLNFPNM